MLDIRAQGQEQKMCGEIRQNPNGIPDTDSKPRGECQLAVFSIAPSLETSWETQCKEGLLQGMLLQFVLAARIGWNGDELKCKCLHSSFAS